MKATLTFNLPEEREEFEIAQKGWAYQVVLFELDQFLRSKTKYEELTEEQYECYESIREKLREILNDYEVSI